MGKPLEQFRGASLDQSCVAVHDEVFLEAGWMYLGALDRERYPWITRDVLQLALIGAQVPRDDLVVLQADPDTGDLG
jgi:hypothetical protein